ncbi:ABC transporter, permease protein (cluster 3, basic aa/glutamine/opines) (plasmid) [Cupriavidus necator H850]|jgi:polar amino acid transport system permease protein|uniref:amino acid ABC transporter permease n=1 Tax=Cupriavidus necator TaxID=106590 RepID=UPI00129E2B71|nr:amino acid ABC transporter permease [Cupriavidus necator]KAI3608560.1 ABC transporter, permease protein (cluster 3, basic aa/glutamine/opines) [Cupriavidus necator H850]
MISFDFWPVLSQWPFLLQGIWLTVLLTAFSAAAGTLLGIGCAWARLHAPGWIRAIVGGYVEVIRNTPYIIQLFFVFFGLPSIGVRLAPEVACVLSMTLNLGAYACEIVRAGLVSTPRGQIEAAQSLALDRWQIFTRVVLPPALKRVWPALVGQVIIVMLGSSVCSQISAEEVSYAANLIASRTFRNFESYIVVTAAYLALAVLVRQALNWIGPRFVFGR